MKDGKRLQKAYQVKDKQDNLRSVRRIGGVYRRGSYGNTDYLADSQHLQRRDRICGISAGGNHYTGGIKFGRIIFMHTGTQMRYVGKSRRVNQLIEHVEQMQAVYELSRITGMELPQAERIVRKWYRYWY